MKRLLLILSLVSFSLTVQADTRIIAVTGAASFEREADVIEVSFYVKNINKTDLSEAKKEVDAISQKAVAALVELGVSEEDIFSPEIRIEYEQDYDKGDCPQKYLPIVFRSMGVTLRDIQLYTKLIDTLLESGVTGIDDVESQLSDIEQHEKKAMSMAIQDAKDQAKFYVESFGGRLGKVHSIGRKSSGRDYGYGAEQIEVYGTRNRLKVKEPYNFRPAPIDVDASVYVEFQID